MPPGKKPQRTRSTPKKTKPAITVTGVDVFDGGRYVVHWTDSKKHEHSDLVTIPFLKELVAGSGPDVAARYQTLLDAIHSHKEKK